MQRPQDIQTDRLRLSVLSPEEIEALIAGDVRPVEVAIALTYPPEDPNRGVDLAWHLKAVRRDCNHFRGG